MFFNGKENSFEASNNTQMTNFYPDNKKVDISILLSFFEKYIYDLFLITSPVYGIALYYSNNNLGNAGENAEMGELMAFAEKLSNKHALEEIMINGEAEIINLFRKSIDSIHNDLVQIFNRDIGGLFTYNEDTLIQMGKVMRDYRNILLPKIYELNKAYYEMNNFLIQTEEGKGDLMKKFIKGGALGALGASLFGPLGIAVAVGANYFSETEEAEKKSAILDSLIENWERASNSLYSVQLKEYYRVYSSFIKKISLNYKEHYQVAYKFAMDINKKEAFENYLNNEKLNLENNKEAMEVGKEAESLRNFFN